MNKRNSHIFQWFNIQHPVYGCLIHVLFNLTKSMIVNHQAVPRFGLFSTFS